MASHFGSWSRYLFHSSLSPAGGCWALFGGSRVLWAAPGVAPFLFFSFFLSSCNYLGAQEDLLGSFSASPWSRLHCWTSQDSKLGSAPMRIPEKEDLAAGCTSYSSAAA